MEASGTSGGMGGGLAAKSASLQRNVQPQWPSLHGGSIVSGYLDTLDIVSRLQLINHRVPVCVVADRLEPCYILTLV